MIHINKLLRIYTIKQIATPFNVLSAAFYMPILLLDITALSTSSDFMRSRILPM